MRLVSLTLDYPLVAFDCGDEDLNKFLLDSLSLSQLLTYNSLYLIIKACAPALIYGFSCFHAREVASFFHAIP